MPYQMQWTDDERIALYSTLNGDVNWAELNDVRETLMHLLEEAPGKVDILLEVHISLLLPIRFFANRQYISSSPVFSHPKVRHLMVIGANQYFKSLYAIFAAVYPAEMVRRVVFVPSFENALQAIKEDPPR